MTSKNPFELLNDDDEGEGSSPPLVKEVRKDEKAKPSASDKPAQSAPPKNAASSGSKPGEQKPSAGGATNSRGGRAPEGNNRPKRQFERHSGTGRGRAADGQEDKRGGAGKYNWGSKASGTMPEDEAQDKMAPKGDDENDESASPEKKKEDEQLSLDEYLQQKKDAQAGLAALAARSVDAFDMKGLKPVLKEEEEDLSVGEGKGAKGKNKRSGRNKEIVTDVNFTTPPIIRDSPRTMRGGPRGGGRSGGDRGPRGGGPGANIVLDDSSFPSLS